MKLLDGTEVAEYLQQRHVRVVRGLGFVPGLAIVRMGTDAATTKYLMAKQRYGDDIGVPVTVYSETAATILSRIRTLNDQRPTTGIIVQLPLESEKITSQVLAAVAPEKDVDGLGPHSPFDTATPKAVLWLLAAYNVETKNKCIAVVGQGRLIGRPLADMLEASGSKVQRIDIDTSDLAAKVLSADIVISATGKPGLIASDMLKDGAVIVDCGSPKSELAADIVMRKDLTRTPNPGGVGPMTVAALFDNLLIAAENSRQT